MLARFLQVIQPDHPFQAILERVAQQLEFLGSLFLLIVVGGADNHVDRQLRMAGIPGPETVFHPAVRANGFYRKVIGNIPFQGAADTPDIQLGIRAYGNPEPLIVMQFRCRAQVAAPGLERPYHPLVVVTFVISETGRVSTDHETAAGRVAGYQVIKFGEEPVFRHVDQYIGRGRLIGSGVISGYIHGDRVGRRPAERQPAGEVFVITQVRPVPQVFHVTVPVPGGQREAARQALAHGDVHITVGVNAVITAGRHLHPAEHPVGGRFLGDHGDGAAYGISSEQRALRTAQHLDPLHVHRIHDLADGTGDIHPIQVNTHTRINGQGPVGAADAADHDDGCRIAGSDWRGKIEYDVGGELTQVGEVNCAAFLQVGSSECRDRYGRVLQTFFTLSGGYYNLLQGARLREQFGRCSYEQASGQKKLENANCISGFVPGVGIGHISSPVEIIYAKVPSLQAFAKHVL